MLLIYSQICYLS